MILRAAAGSTAFRTIPWRSLPSRRESRTPATLRETMRPSGPTDDPMLERPLLAELQRRRVFRATVSDGVATFAVLQIAEPIMHALHWPDRVLTWIVLLLAAGFPLVVVLAWIFDVREGRIERTPHAGGP